MHYLVVTYCFSGDLVPFINFALEARAAGIRVTFAAEREGLARYPPYWSRLEHFELLDTYVEATDAPMGMAVGGVTFGEEAAARVAAGSKRFVPYYRRLRAALAPFFRKEKPDLVVAHFRAVAALDIAKEAGIPSVVLSPSGTRPAGFAGRPAWWWMTLQARLPLVLRPLAAVAWFAVDLWLLLQIRNVRREYGVSAPLEWYPSGIRWVEASIWGYSETPAAGPLHEELVGPLISSAWEDPMPPGIVVVRPPPPCPLPPLPPRPRPSQLSA